MTLQQILEEVKKTDSSLWSMQKNLLKKRRIRRKWICETGYHKERATGFAEVVYCARKSRRNIF